MRSSELCVSTVGVVFQHKLDCSLVDHFNIVNVSLDWDCGDFKLQRHILNMDKLNYYKLFTFFLGNTYEAFSQVEIVDHLFVISSTRLLNDSLLSRNTPIYPFNSISLSGENLLELAKRLSCTV